LESSIFVLELSQLTIQDIKSFCDQRFPEGLRIEYKEDFPKNLKIADTICAFANTQGGIILIGVKAEKKKNTPTAVPGIELRDGLEERVINVCLSSISPTIAPEVKVCDFKSDPNKSVRDLAVLFIRVRSSYTAPHYLINNNKIMIRVHNRNALADLRTIENLINRREKVISADGMSSVFYQGKKISVENEIFESVVIAPQFRSEQPLINFYNKENSDWLLETTNGVMRFNERRPTIWDLSFVGLNSSRQVTRYCNIERWGKIIFQRPAVVQKTEFISFASIVLLIKALEAAQKIYSHFGFYGDLSVGLTIVNVKDLVLGFPKNRYADNFRCEKKVISISKDLRYDELTHLNGIMEDIFQELCMHFGAVLPEKTTVDIVKEVFLSLK